jgi:hypothetical protein
MPPRHREPPPPPPPEEAPPPPPYYVAKEHLPFSGPGAATVYAFSAGDHVPPDLVEAQGWGGLVELPEEFSGVLPEPSPPEVPPSGGEEKEA